MILRAFVNRLRVEHIGGGQTGYVDNHWPGCVTAVKIGKAHLCETAQQSPEGLDIFIDMCGDQEQDFLYHCPCCRYPTLTTRGSYEICEVCFWEDDGQDNHDAHKIRGGPNGDLSLTMARDNFLSYGACEKEMEVNVRKPSKIEKRYRHHGI